MSNERGQVPAKHQENTVETKNAESENISSSPVQLTTASASLPNINRMSSMARQQTMVQLQRQHGNAQVQRMLSGVIQRDDVGTGTKDSFKAKLDKLPVNKKLGSLPITLKEMSLNADISYSTTDDKNASTQVRTGQNRGVDPSKGQVTAGVQGEVEQSWKTKVPTALGDIQFKSKGAAEVTTAGAKIGADIVTASLGALSVSLKVDILKYDAEKSEFSAPSFTVQGALEVYKYETTLSDGRTYKVSVKPSLDFVFEPDYVAIGRWFAEQYAKSAVSAIGAVGSGMIAAGFATLAAAYVNMGLGKEISGRAEEAYKQSKEFATVYAHTLRGEALTINGRGGSLGFDAGNRVIRKVVTEDKSTTIEAFQQAARARSLSSEAWQIGWPIITQKALEAYKEEHWFEWTVYGEDGPGYNTLKRVLDSYN